MRRSLPLHKISMAERLAVKKAHEPMERQASTIVDQTTLENMLVMGKVYGNPGTDGSWWSNFKFFVLNKHPILGIFYAHHEHPFSRKERLAALFATTCWTLCVASYLNNNNFESMNVYARIFLNSALTLPVGFFIYQILAMPTCQNKRWPRMYAMRERCESAGHFIMFFIILLSAFFLTTVHHQLKACKMTQEQIDENKSDPDSGKRTTDLPDGMCDIGTVIGETAEAKVTFWFVTWFAIYGLQFFVRWMYGGDKKWFNMNFNEANDENKVSIDDEESMNTELVATKV
jgi:hypothetical protein